MFKKVVVMPTILLALLCMIVLSISAHSHKTRSRNGRVISDSIIYALVFHLIDSNEKEAEKMPDEETKIFLKNHIAKDAGLSEEQHQILKTLAANFISAANLVPHQEKLRLSLKYKNELKKLLGVEEFRRFDSYLRDRLGSSIKILKSDNVLVYGESFIDVDYQYHILRGSSQTRVFGLTSRLIENCTVSATMTGPNVSVSGTDTDPGCFDHNPTVELTSTVYLPNSQYCQTATHTIGGEGSSSSSRCLTTLPETKVTSVVYERISSDDLPIDNNPDDNNPSIENGLRIFPDKNLPTESIAIDRRKIRVRAKIGSNTAGVRVYFRSFDPDDPSASVAPIDAETTANAGDDNKGNVDGTVNTRSGKFSTSLSQYDCQVSFNNANCVTDSNGEAVVYFTVTMQPGDNFTIAAGNEESYLGGLVLAADGINLKDTSNLQTPVNTTNNVSVCYSSSANACRADMLTVWRRLHIEVDSMGAVTGNKIEGQFPAIGKVGTGIQTLPVTVSPALEPNRFENGRIVIGSRPFKIINNDPAATPPVNANTTNTVTINNNTGRIFSIAAGEKFTLYDDDDFNNNDGTTLDGDNLPSPGEDVAEPNIDLLQPNDTVCNVEANGQINNVCNALMPAYVVPKYDLSGSHENIEFFLNAHDFRIFLIYESYFNNKVTEAQTDFWTMYMLGAYQYTFQEDSDPDESEGVYGIASDLGFFSFMELGRSVEFEDLDKIRPPGIDVWRNRPIANKYINLHELGHLFDGQHDDCLGSGESGNAGVMAILTTVTKGVYCDETLNKIRGGTGILNP